MKLLSKLCDDVKNSLKDDRPILCEYVSAPQGLMRLDTPIISCEKECDWCRGTACYCPFVDPTQSSARTWLCANTLCDVYVKRSPIKTTPHLTKASRALLWPKFCEINGIGDLNYDVKFESLDQDAAKVSYMLKFATTPRNILFMRGNPGTGKTYAAMAICELYTRKDTSCIFTTQKQMSNNWLETFKAERYSNYIERVSNTCLLVIDDFGTAEMPPGFLSFFMDLINTRMQWSNRGTVITTNLNAKNFMAICGEALSDRIMTGMIFVYDDKTRRKKNIL